MSQRNHLKRAVKILWNNFENDIRKSHEWTWNLKNWTLHFYIVDDYESVVAYSVKEETTNWSNGIYLEQRQRKWEELV